MPDKGDQERRDCRNCGPAHHQYMGFVPELAIRTPAEVTRWVKIWACTACGAVEEIEPRSDDVDDAQQMLVKFWAENDIMDQDEANEVLGMG